MALIQVVDAANIAAGRTNTLADVIGIRRTVQWAGEANRPPDLVPVANFGIDSVSGLWIPEVFGPGGVPVTDILRENAYYFVTVDLNVLRAVPTQILYGALAITGRSITTWNCTGNANLRLSGAANDAMPLATMLWPNMITIEQDLTSVWVDNVAQPGATLTFRIGRRV